MSIMNNKLINNMQRKNRGFSIVELMIAILIGLIILTGLVTVFDTSQRMSRTQNGLARIQENGRYVLSLMRDQIAQAGYSSCFGEKEESPVLGGPINTLLPPPPAALATTKIAWDIQSSTFMPGVPLEATPSGKNAFDPAYLLFGHECDAGGTCIPALTDPGADTSANVPAVGTGDGARIAGTDVLTVRYLRGGREVDTVNSATNTITLTPFASANPPATIPTSGQVLLMSCENVSPTVLDIVSIGAGAITTLQAPPNMSVIPKVYNLQRDLVNVTYYVANKVVDGRSIPTLYSSFNGVANAVIEGVDAFDVVYGVKDAFSNTMYINADEVQNNLGPLNCWPAPKLLGSGITGGNGDMTNVAGCGWRSVATVEIHLLLNTIYNSTNDDIGFRYSLYGSGDSATTDILSTIPHYNMHRKEFTATIALKNIIH